MFSDVSANAALSHLSAVCPLIGHLLFSTSRLARCQMSEVLSKITLALTKFRCCSIFTKRKRANWLGQTILYHWRCNSTSYAKIPPSQSDGFALVQYLPLTRRELTYTANLSMFNRIVRTSISTETGIFSTPTKIQITLNHFHSSNKRHEIFEKKIDVSFQFWLAVRLFS